MVKLDRPLCPLDPRHVADPGDNSGGRVQLQIGKAGGIGAQRLIAANDDRHALLAIGDDADMDAFDLRAQRILSLVDRHAEAPGGGAVDVELEIVYAVIGDGQQFVSAIDVFPNLLTLTPEHAPSRPT